MISLKNICVHKHFGGELFVEYEGKLIFIIFFWFKNGQKKNKIRLRIPSKVESN